MLEACYVQKKGNTLDSSTIVQKTDWEIYIIQLGNEITKEQTPQRLLAARYVFFNIHTLYICINNFKK